MAFDYEAQPDTPDDVIRRIGAEMSGGGLKPLSDAERLEREIWRAQRAQERALADEQRKIERERQEAEKEAVARQEAAESLALANRQAREKARQEYCASVSVR
jgi:hypothetical protein